MKKQKKNLKMGNEFKIWRSTWLDLGGAKEAETHCGRRFNGMLLWFSLLYFCLSVCLSVSVSVSLSPLINASTHKYTTHQTQRGQTDREREETQREKGERERERERETWLLPSSSSSSSSFPACKQPESRKKQNPHNTYIHTESADKEKQGRAFCIQRWSLFCSFLEQCNVTLAIFFFFFFFFFKLSCAAYITFFLSFFLSCFLSFFLPSPCLLLLLLLLLPLLIAAKGL